MCKAILIERDLWRYVIFNAPPEVTTATVSGAASTPTTAYDSLPATPAKEATPEEKDKFLDLVRAAQTAAQ